MTNKQRHTALEHLRKAQNELLAARTLFSALEEQRAVDKITAELAKLVDNMNRF